MTDNKKKRMSMLDSLASAGTPVAAPSMMSSNRALRSARDALDAHHVWELDPADVEDGRFADRLDPNDVADLRTSIEVNGQTVPILVRRHPSEANRYLLVYGRRRLEAIRSSDKVKKVRALIASLDDSAALRAQVSENTGRRELSYIERALFARELLESGFGNQAEIAEVLNATRSAVSMAISVAKTVGSELAKAIGPAHGVGRPRWEALVKLLSETSRDRSQLVGVAMSTRQMPLEEVVGGYDGEHADPSAAAFEAVVRQLKKGSANARAEGERARTTTLNIQGKSAGTVRRTASGLRLDLTNVEDGFATWFENRAQDLLGELHERWQQRSRGEEEQQ
jgi:ParB family chromosome partitioning protein